MKYQIDCILDGVRLYSKSLGRLYSKSLGLSLFIKHTDGQKIFVLIYVDDLLITGSDMGLIQDTKNILQT